MVRHVVMFRLKGAESERRTVATIFRDALLALPEQIPQLISMNAYLNENPAEQWDIVLEATVPTMADVAVYAAHPAHVAATKIIADCKDARACVDYSIPG